MQDNLRAALNWTIETTQTEKALTLTRNLAWAWFRRSEFQESHRLFERVLNMPGAKEFKSLYIEVLIFFARGTWLELGSEKATPIIEEALKEAHNIEDKTNLAWALTVQSLIFTTAGHTDQSLAASMEAKSIFEELENQHGYAHAILSIALCASYQKNHKEALVYYQDAYNLFAMHEDIFFQNVAQRWIGVHEIALNNFEIGLSALQKALRTAQVMESNNEIALAVWEFAKSARLMGNYPRAVRLSMAFKTIQSNLGTWTQADEAGLEKILHIYQEQMDAASFEVAREQGLALSLDQTIEYALQV
jgi:tetratricopeptide (TPR) repeat protein